MLARFPSDIRKALVEALLALRHLVVEPCLRILELRAGVLSHYWGRAQVWLALRRPLLLSVLAIHETLRWRQHPRLIVILRLITDGLLV